MLQIIAGRSGSGKTERIFQEICSRPEGERIILLVPEQSSFQSEKRILNTLGASGASEISVLSFRRLYDAVTEKYGGAGARRIDEGVKAVIMSLAAEAVSDKLVLYGSRSKRSDLAQLMLSAVNEYKMCAVTPEMLVDAALHTDDMRLRQKLTESAAVYSAYEAMLGTAYSDPDDDMTRLYEMLCTHSYFSGARVYIDSFNGFSGQERRILEEIMCQAEYVCVALCCDKSSARQAESSIFREPDITLRQLLSIAGKTGTEVLPTIWLDRQLRYKNESLAAVECSVFRFDGDPYYTDDNAVTVYEADDEYDEIQYTAREISRLVRDEGYEYRDITVVCRAPDMYRNIIASEYPKFGIPYFMSEQKPLEDKPLIRLVLSAFEVIHSSFATENILSFLKTGLTPLSEHDVFTLENYVYMWDIKGRHWKQPFTMDPDGNTGSPDMEKLSRLEGMRQSVIAPLTAFGKALSSAGNGGEISEAVYRLLESLGTAKRMKQLIGFLNELIDPKQKETEARIWDIVMDLLDKLHTILRNTPVTSRRYYELFRLMLSKNPISDIPQTLDQVIIGTAGGLRSEKQRAVFVIGAADGVFPAVPTASGIFSDSERIALLSMELPLYDSVFGMSLKEKFIAYAALSLPTEKLFVSRHLSNSKGEPCEPSVILRELTSILKNLRVLHRSDLPADELFFTEEQAFEECALRWHDNDSVSETLRAHFASSPDYSDRYNAVYRAVNEEPFALNNRAQTRKLFGEKLTLSASQAETYYLCPFRYFCRYGLKAYPRKKADMDSAMYGSAVHYILENMLRDIGFSNLSSADEDKLRELVHEYIEKYLLELGSSQDRTSRFLAQFEIIERNLTAVLRRLIEEFSVSSFVPSDFELTIDEGGEVPAYELELPGGEKVSLIGKVDRVDTFIRNGEKYIRIVDYKTGNKKFRLSDILYGLNLQMLLYLSVINRNGAGHYSENKYRLAPAGILYMPSTPASSTGDLHTGEVRSELIKKQQSAFRMNGLLIDDPEILKAMEKDARGVFIPARLNSRGKLEQRGKSAVSSEEYGRIFSYIDKKLMEMAKSLYDGDIRRSPAKGSTDACAYCDYKTVCGYEDGKPCRTVTNMSIDKTLESIHAEEGRKDG